MLQCDAEMSNSIERGHFTLKSFRRNERETKQQRIVELWIYSQVGCQVTST